MRFKTDDALVTTGMKYNEPFLLRDRSHQATDGFATPTNDTVKAMDVRLVNKTSKAYLHFRASLCFF
jgi:hypothetical protein